jgi:hypothetical protein
MQKQMSSDNRRHLSGCYGDRLAMLHHQKRESRRELRSQNRLPRGPLLKSLKREYSCLLLARACMGGLFLPALDGKGLSLAHRCAGDAGITPESLNSGLARSTSRCTAGGDPPALLLRCFDAVHASGQERPSRQGRKFKLGRAACPNLGRLTTP